ncbi:DUF2087 domain-containing protein [Acaricomes phytoseiuli]|uniref:DUF2087 domain-containing protein n=1 Tax=Acaricomes phytoseiuli TaxID=291968 RepID=UPI002223B7C2|nr:DUF2087 domain-containing protein [Acaricomes phytoseiuli]MCW1250337.1 DUF2087 domain-containing protein [Acaricomes phytoseiuli]
MTGKVSWRQVFAVLRQPRLRQVYAAAVLGVMLDQVRSSELDRLVQAGLLTSSGTGYQVNEAVYEQLLAAYQEQQPSGTERYLRVDRLRALPGRARERSAVLRKVCDLLFEPDHKYTVREVVTLLRVIGEDVPELRRALLDEGFLERKSDGSAYWLAGKG